MSISDRTQVEIANAESSVAPASLTGDKRSGASESEANEVVFGTRREFLLGTATATLAMTDPFHLAEAGSDGEETPRASMRTCKIPNTDLTVSRIAYGNAMLSIDSKQANFMAQAIRAMNIAYDNGITFFDTADTYGAGRSESALALLFKQSAGLRKKVVVQSKCSLRYRDGHEIVDNSKDHILSAVEGSLRRLNVDHLDILLLHRPDSLVEPEEVAVAFDTLEKAGKVRYFGLSNFGPAQYELLQKTVRQRLVTNQIQLGLMHWNVSPHAESHAFIRADGGVMTLEYCRLRDIKVQAYSPLRSQNSGLANFPDLLNPSVNASPATMNAVKLLADLAEKYSVTPAGIMLAWLMRHPAEIIPVIGSTKDRHVIESCAADSVRLTRDEWYSLLSSVTRLQVQPSS